MKLTRWTEKEDELVVQTIIRCIENGDKLKNGFNYLKGELQRTEAAIRYRWDSRLSKLHKEKVKLAKEKQQKKYNTNQRLNVITKDEFLDFIDCYIDQKVKQKYQELSEENEQLRNQVNELKRRLESYKEIELLIQEFNKSALNG